MAVVKFNMNRKRDNYAKESGIQISDDSDKKKQSKCPVVTILLLIHVDVLVAALVTLVAYFSYEDAQHNLPLLEMEQIQEISIYCDDISLGIDDDDDDDDTRSANKNGFKMYVNKYGKYVCTYKSKDMKKLISKVVEQTSMLRLSRGLETRQYLSCGNESLAAKSGHLTFTLSGVSKHQKYEGKSSDIKLHWDKHPEQSYVAPVIHYHNGEITIPEGRTYYIYASVHFNMSRGDDKTDRPRKFTLRICRKVYGYEQTLLGKTQLFNISHGDVVSSLNVGSYLQMSRNDTIYVKVSDAYSIIRESQGNTFGMFPISA